MQSNPLPPPHQQTPQKTSSTLLPGFDDDFNAGYKAQKNDIYDQSPPSEEDIFVEPIPDFTSTTNPLPTQNNNLIDLDAVWDNPVQSPST